MSRAVKQSAPSAEALCANSFQCFVDGCFDVLHGHAFVMSFDVSNGHVENAPPYSVLDKFIEIAFLKATLRQKVAHCGIGVF